MSCLSLQVIVVEWVQWDAAIRLNAGPAGRAIDMAHSQE